MIKFKIIRWKNLLSTGNTFTEVKLDSNNTTLIIGKNGSGKSTILDALSFVLFNKPFRNITKPNLVNSINKKDCVVEVEFEIKGVEYKVVRGIKPNKFEVYSNGNLINQEVDSDDYQAKFEKTILKTNHNTFCKIIVVGAASYVPFMQLKTPQRREFIDDILNLKVVTTMNSLLSDKIKINDSAVKDNGSQKNLANEKIKLISEHIKELENSSEKLSEEKAEKIKLTEIRIAELHSENGKIREQILPLSKKYESIDKLNATKLKINSMASKLTASKESQEETIDFLNGHETCPTCSQGISSDFKCETIQSKQDKIKEIEENLDVLRKEYKTVIDKIKTNEEIQSQIKDLETEISKNNLLISSNKQYIEELKQEIKLVSKEDINNNKKKIKDLNTELLKLEKEYEELLQEKQILTIAQAMLKDNGIKASIVKQYIPVINKYINKYLAAMDFFVSFELDENFNETIKSRFIDNFKYESFSEGEKAKIDYALILTWRQIAKMRNSVNSNILFLDEVFDGSMDADTNDNVMYIIQKMENTNVFIISHKEQYIDKFENIIKFEKTKNFSSIINK